MVRNVVTPFSVDLAVELLQLVRFITKDENSYQKGDIGYRQSWSCVIHVSDLLCRQAYSAFA